MISPDRITLYRTTAIATGDGRNGAVEVEESELAFRMAAPTALGGSGDGANPEQLFAAGYAACFKSAFLAACRARRLNGGDAVVRTDVRLDKMGSAFSLAVDIHVEVPPDLPDPESLVNAASATCPYSNAIRGNVPVLLTWTVRT